MRLEVTTKRLKLCYYSDTYIRVTRKTTWTVSDNNDSIRQVNYIN